MPEITFPFSDRVTATVRWLLPRTSSTVTELLEQAHLLVSDYAHVQGLIGMPSTVDETLARLDLSLTDRLPPAVSGPLASSVRVFALAKELFADRDAALQWWAAPLRLYPERPARTPRDWLDEPGAAIDLAKRINRTLNGIY